MVPIPVVNVTSGGTPPPSALGVGWVMKYVAATNSFQHLSRIPGNGFDADVIFTGGDIQSAVAADFDGPGISQRKQPQLLASFSIITPIKNWFGFTVGYVGSFLYEIKAYNSTAKNWSAGGKILQTSHDWPSFVMQHRPLLAVVAQIETAVEARVAALDVEHAERERRVSRASRRERLHLRRLLRGAASCAEGD